MERTSFYMRLFMEENMIGTPTGIIPVGVPFLFGRALAGKRCLYSSRLSLKNSDRLQKQINRYRRGSPERGRLYEDAWPPPFSKARFLYFVGEMP